MAPRHSFETVEAAVAAHRRGEKSPVICNRYRISERTLYRWIRSAARDRAVREIRTTLRLDRERAERLLGAADDPEE